MVHRDAAWPGLQLIAADGQAVLPQRGDDAGELLARAVGVRGRAIALDLVRPVAVESAARQHAVGGNLHIEPGSGKPLYERALIGLVRRLVRRKADVPVWPEDRRRAELGLQLAGQRNNRLAHVPLKFGLMRIPE